MGAVYPPTHVQVCPQTLHKRQNQLHDVGQYTREVAVDELPEQNQKSGWKWMES